MLQVLSFSIVVMGFLTSTLTAKESYIGQCSNRTLKGSFGVYADGTIIGVGPTAFIAIFTYDGERNVTGTGTPKTNGNVAHITFTGTYTVDENCNVSQIILTSNGVTIMHELVIVDNGKEFYILNTTPGTTTSGNVSVGVGKKQFPGFD